MGEADVVVARRMEDSLRSCPKEIMILLYCELRCFFSCDKYAKPCLGVSVIQWNVAGVGVPQYIFFIAGTSVIMDTDIPCVHLYCIM